VTQCCASICGAGCKTQGCLHELPCQIFSELLGRLRMSGTGQAVKFADLKEGLVT
jgi:hypothetical protein